MKKQFKREGIFLSRGFNTVRKFLLLRNIAYASSVMLLVLIVSTIIPIYYKPVTAEATVGTATESTLTFTSTRSAASVTLAVSSADGTFATSTNEQKASFSISTNNYTGYTLTLKSGGNVTALDNSGTTISTIGATTDYDTFTANTAAGKALNNKWGIIPNYYNSAVNTENYYPAPTSTNAITLRTTSSANIDNADDYTIGLGLRADYTNPSGIYENNAFILEYVANPVGYNITYSADGISGVSNLPGVQAGNASHTETSSTSGDVATTTTGATSVTLSSTVPTRTGYTFSGWCLGTLSNNGTTCTGTTYASGASFGIDKTANNASITLKATWTINTYAITFTFGTGISDIVVKDSTGDNTIVTISTSGGSTNLTYSTTYKIVPTYASGYVADSITKASGAGTLDTTNYTFMVGDGVAELNMTSKVPPQPLYNLVAAMSKGKQTTTGIRAAITAANSGVYEYNATVFGTASDAANTSAIYYYRGILDETTGTYGSNGDGKAYPNYVILDADGNKTTTDTCWRIVRTTGSGGVKMIYNGKWTGSTCANAGTNAQTIGLSFNTSSQTVLVGKSYKTYTGLKPRNMHAIGYTYSTVAAGTTTNTALSRLLGSSGNDTTTNSKSSIIKQYIEDWYDSNLSSYTSILEPSAGYCNDRTVYPSGSYQLSSKLAEDTQVKPYGTSNMTAYYFGAFTRNTNTAQTPTLNCPRGIVDLYSTTTASGGNGQLSKPVALLTADEASFAGSGSSAASLGSSYHANSFLRSGSYFWLLSPNRRDSYGYAYEFILQPDGTLSSYGVDGADISLGVRPAISLTPGTTVSSGSGTATDPWVVEAPV